MKKEIIKPKIKYTLNPLLGLIVLDVFVILFLMWSLR